MAGQHRGAFLQAERAAYNSNIIVERGQRDLRGRHATTFFLKEGNDSAPARTVSPCPMNQYDIRIECHLRFLSTRMRGGLPFQHLVHLLVGDLGKMFVSGANSVKRLRRFSADEFIDFGLELVAH